MACQNFPGCPVVKTSASNVGSEGSIPDQGAKIPHALWPKNQNIKQKHVTQQSHFWAYTPRKPDLKETRAPQCSSQHCLS